MHHYIIVGAGAAGCVLANRLSEDPDARVLLLEAGPPDGDELIDMPLGFGALLKSGYDWDDGSEPEEHLNGRRIPLGHGRVLGGSTAINAMIYLRGNRVDFDGWAAGGLDGWGYDDVLPYFKRSEDNERFNNVYHAQGGPLGVSDSRAMTPCVDAMIEAIRAIGIPSNDDFNGATQDGVGRVQSTTRDGRRCSTATAFLHPVMERANLEVVTHAHVTRLLFEGRRATGVEYERFGTVEQAGAENEVILSAGAYATPQLLMLSGIGPAEDLKLMLIDVLEDLPVGRNLQDHCMAALTYFAHGGTLESAFTPENQALYVAERRGPLSSNVGEACAFIRTRSESPAPDLQITLAPVMVHEELLGPAFASAVSVVPTLVAPTSRGQVTLRTAQPKSKVRIRHNYLETDEDRRTMIEGARMAMEIAVQEPFRDISKGPHLVPDSQSDADVLAFLRKHALTIWHPVGTCAMGSVVDDQLRVLGVDALRVVDASVMPVIPRANTNAATIMIGEKGADLIRGRVRADANNVLA